MNTKIWKKSIFYTLLFTLLTTTVVLFSLFRINMGPDMVFISNPADAEQIIKHKSLFFENHLALWDASWYRQIVTSGYTEESSAFFPLFPSTVKLFYELTGNFNWAAGIVSFLALVISIFFLLRFSESLTNPTLKKEEGNSNFAIFFFLFFPTSFFLLAPYSESLFIPLLIAAIYYIKQKKFTIAIILGILLGLCRVNGFVFGIIPLFYLITQSKNIKERIKYGIAIISPLIGTAIYGFFLHFKFGKFLQFLEAQKLWRRNFDPSLNSIFGRYAVEWQDFISSGTLFHPKSIMFLTDALFFLIFASLGIWIWFKWKKEYALLLFGFILIPALTGTFSSLPRLVLPAVPLVAIFLAEKIKSREIKQWILISSVAFWILFLIMFVNLYWVA